MNKTVDINLAGIIFHLDEEAYKALTDYLRKVKAQFSSKEVGDEIMADIEARIAELFHEALQGKRQVINEKDVEKVIATMGQPEDYRSDDDGDDNEDSTRYKSTYTGNTGRRYRQLYRNPDDKILGGVAGGLGAYFQMDPLWIRLAFVALFFGAGTGFWVYIILWIVVPEARTTAQKLQMEGEAINISNIEKKVMEEMEEVKQRLKDLGKSESVQRTKRRATEGIEDLTDTVVTMLKQLFKFVFKILGVALMFAGFLVLVGLISLFLGAGVYIDGVFVGLSEISQYATALMPDGFGMQYLWISVSLTVVAPIVAIIWLGIRLIFGNQVTNRAVSVIAGMVTTAGVVMLFILGVAMIRDFSSEGSDSRFYALNGASTEAVIVLEANETGIPRDYDTDWRFGDTKQYISNVNLDIRYTRETEPYLEVRKESRGRNRYDAEKKAIESDFKLGQNGSRIEMSSYLTIGRNQKFRGQEANVILYLPVGYSIYLDRSTKYILDDVANTIDLWDPKMVEHQWIMTDEGLACLDCLPKRDHDEWDDEDLEGLIDMEKVPPVPGPRKDTLPVF